MGTRVRLAAGLLALVGCDAAPSAPCGDGFGRADDGVCRALAGLDFAGIDTAAWDGADGLSASWSPAGDAIGAVTYTLSAETIDGTPVASTTTAATDASLPTLGDGEYVLRVVATDTVARTGGADRGLRQVVGVHRLVYRSEVPFAGGGRTVAGDGDLVAVGGGEQDGDGVMLVDVADALAPTVVSTIPDLGEVTDVELADGLLFVATDTTLHPDATVCVRIYDVSDPAHPVLASSIPAADDSAHTLAYGDGHLFLASTLHQWEAIYDVRDPTAPVRVGVWAPPPPAGVHDETWIDGRLYVAWTQGMSILDVTDPTAPALLSILEADWADPFVHNLWPTDDATTLAMSEEAVGGMLRVYDIRALASPVLTGSFQTAADHSIHNVVVRGNYAFAAWYVDGLVVLDLSDRAAPTEIDRYDTYDGDESPEVRSDGTEWPNVGGATHVWPLGAHVAVSDANRGLVLFDFFPDTIRWGDAWAK